MAPRIRTRDVQSVEADRRVRKYEVKVRQGKIHLVVAQVLVQPLQAPHEFSIMGRRQLHKISIWN